jgi:hypothetical protein
MVLKILCPSEYWSGATFIPKRPEIPPYLTFLGSQVFGYVCAAPPTNPLTTEQGGTEEHAAAGLEPVTGHKKPKIAPSQVPMET